MRIVSPGHLLPAIKRVEQDRVLVGIQAEFTRLPDDPQVPELLQDQERLARQRMPARQAWIVRKEGAATRIDRAKISLEEDRAAQIRSRLVVGQLGVVLRLLRPYAIKLGLKHVAGGVEFVVFLGAVTLGPDAYGLLQPAFATRGKRHKLDDRRTSAWPLVSCRPILSARYRPHPDRSCGCSSNPRCFEMCQSARPSSCKVTFPVAARARKRYGLRQLASDDCGQDWPGWELLPYLANAAEKFIAVRAPCPAAGRNRPGPVPAVSRRASRRSCWRRIARGTRRLGGVGIARLRVTTIVKDPDAEFAEDRRAIPASARSIPQGRVHRLPSRWMSFPDRMRT